MNEGEVGGVPRRRVLWLWVIPWALGVPCFVSCSPTPYYRWVEPVDWIWQNVRPTVTDLSFVGGVISFRRWLPNTPAIDAVDGWRWHGVVARYDSSDWSSNWEEDGAALLIPTPSGTGSGTQFLVRVPVFAIPLVWAVAWFVRLGVRVATRERRLAAGQCVGCGYDLRANTSGRCPECGVKFGAAGGGAR